MNLDIQTGSDQNTRIRNWPPRKSVIKGFWCGEKEQKNWNAPPPPVKPRVTWYFNNFGYCETLGEYFQFNLLRLEAGVPYLPTICPNGYTTHAMVLLLDGNSEIGAHVRRNLCHLIYLRLLVDREMSQIGFIYPKRSGFLHACSTRSE